MALYEPLDPFEWDFYDFAEKDFRESASRKNSMPWRPVPRKEEEKKRKNKSTKKAIETNKSQLVKMYRK